MWRQSPKNLKPLEIKWEGMKWSRKTSLSYGTTKHSTCMYMDTTFTRRYGKLQLVKLVCECRSQGTLTTEPPWLLKRTGKSLDMHLSASEEKGSKLQKVSRLCDLFLKRGGNVHCTVTIMAVHLFIELIVQHA